MSEKEQTLKELFCVLFSETLDASNKKKKFIRLSNQVVGAWIDEFITEEAKDTICELIEQQIKLLGQSEKILTKVVTEVENLYR